MAATADPRFDLASGSRLSSGLSPGHTPRRCHPGPGRSGARAKRALVSPHRARTTSDVLALAAIGLFPCPLSPVTDLLVTPFAGLSVPDVPRDQSFRRLLTHHSTLSDPVFWNARLLHLFDSYFSSFPDPIASRGGLAP